MRHHEFTGDQLRDRELWSKLGPFAVDRNVVKALGGPVLTHIGDFWFFEGPAVAMVRVDRGAALLDYAYVRPEARGKSLYGKLYEARLKFAIEKGATAARAYVRGVRWHHYAARGWAEIGRRGSWVRAELSL